MNPGCSLLVAPLGLHFHGWKCKIVPATDVASRVLSRTTNVLLNVRYDSTQGFKV